VSLTHGAIARLLAAAKRVLVITGSALSADSGLAHHRGFPGIARKPGDDGKRYDAMLNLETLQQRPQTTWKLLVAMDAAIRAVRPNRGHEVLAALENKLDHFAIVTTNVDRMHQRAGSRNVIEMHGAMYDLSCTRCELVRRHTTFEMLSIPPACTTCGAVLRPNMALFGDSLRDEPFAQLQAELDRGIDLVLAVGLVTVYPYSARPILLAKQDGIRTVEIGQHQTDVSDVVDVRLRATPARALDAIYESFLAGA